jgi:hypothetical protein
MKSKASSKFWKAYNDLPFAIQKLQQSNTDFGLKRLLTHPFNLKKSKSFVPEELRIPIPPLLSWMEIRRFGFGLDLMRNTNY